MIFEGPGRARWHDVAEPVLPSPQAAIVSPLAVATCDLDVGLMRGKAAYFGTGFELGHEAVVRVVEVGDGVADRRPGDVAVVPFQVSCGSCRWCVRGQTAHCETSPGASMYGIGELGGNKGGMLAERFVVPYADHMLVPATADPPTSSLAVLSDNVPDGYRCVSVGLERDPDGRILVVGGRGASIGLYAVQLAIALGAGGVTYVDRDRARCSRAESLGADVLEWPSGDGALSRHGTTIDASGSPSGLRLALRSTDHDGLCVHSAMLFGEATLPMLDLYVDGVTLMVSRNSARRYLPAVLALVESGALDPSPVTDGIATWNEAEEALADPPDKLVILGPDAAP